MYPGKHCLMSIKDLVINSRLNKKCILRIIFVIKFALYYDKLYDSNFK